MANWQEIIDSNSGIRILINLDSALSIVPREALINEKMKVPSIRFLMVDGRVFDWHLPDDNIQKMVYEAVRLSLVPRQLLTQIMDHEVAKYEADDLSNGESAEF